jgi:1-phosphofructokinase family hexose kinase
VIWCVGLNPSWDVAYELADPFTPGAIHTAVAWVGRAGGKGNNAARTVRTLGAPVTAVGLYGGDVGRLVQADLDRRGIPVFGLDVPGDTRMCVTVTEHSRQITEIRGPGPRVGAETVDRLLDKLVAAVSPRDWVTISGSLPPGLPPEAIGRWVSVLRPRVAGVLVDAPPACLEAALAAGCTAILPNAQEFEVLRERGIPSPLRSHMVVSRGGDGVLWFQPDGPQQQIAAPQVAVINPVGAGDVLAGALATALAWGHPWDVTLPWAVAVASASVETLGVADFSPARARTLSRWWPPEAQ